jgi:hypothetical protein
MAEFGFNRAAEVAHLDVKIHIDVEKVGACKGLFKK